MVRPQKNETKDAKRSEVTRDIAAADEGTKVRTAAAQDLSQTADKAFDLPELSTTDFADVFREALMNPNLGAGLSVSGVSGSGKSNLSEWTAIESLRLGIPFIHIDPHGSSARKIARMVQVLPPRLRDDVLYVNFSDPNCIASVNPLEHPQHEQDLTDYQRRCYERIRLELTASIILAAVGEAGTGFGQRPVMRKWTMRWLTLLYRSNLTLPDAAMLLDPQHPIYEQLLKLAPDDLAFYQMSALAGMKATDLENEIGSARNRFLTLLEHPASTAVLARRENTLDFRRIYESGQSLIINLERGEILSEEVQRLLANIMLVQYLQVVFATPEHLRQRRLCIIDELPVFAEACGPLLEQVCTEVRKYKNSFMFLHQGASRFEGRTENTFLLTMLDMCRIKVFFRHKVDSEFFGKQVSLAVSDEPRVKHLQVSEQQFQNGYDIIELTDYSTGETETSGDTTSESHSDALTESLAKAVSEADKKTTTTSGGSSRTKQSGNSSHKSASRTSNQTVKQSAVARIETKRVVTGKTFFSLEEIDRGAASMLQRFDTGEAVLLVDGWSSPVRVMTPLAEDPYSHAIKFGNKKLAEWIRRIAERVEFASPTAILAEHKHFQAALLEELYAMEPRRIGDNSIDGQITIGPRRLALPDVNERPDELGL